VALNAVAPVIGLGIMFPGAGDDSKVHATHVAVPEYLLGEREVEDLDDALDTDHEDDAP
jgi:hypothetical protein